MWIRVRQTLTVVLKTPGKPRPDWRVKLAQFLSQERWGLLVVVAMVFVMQLVEFHGWLAGIEGRLLDMFLRKSSPTEEAGLKSPIVTVEIDDDGYRDCFGGSSPLDPKMLGDMVTELASGSDGPRVLGVDILTDSEKNQKEYQQLSAKWPKKAADQGTAVIWAASGEEARVEAVSFPWWLLGYPDTLVVRPSRVLGTAAENLETAPL